MFSAMFRHTLFIALWKKSEQNRNASKNYSIINITALVDLGWLIQAEQVRHWGLEWPCWLRRAGTVTSTSADR